MSDQRVTASVKRDHIHLMNKLFRWDATANKWVAQPEVFFAEPDMAFHMGNFVGALNKAESDQYPSPVTPPPPPPPVTLPPDCPVTLQIEAEFTKDTRGDPSHPDQNVCVYQMWRTNILVIPFRIPMPANGVNFTQSDMVSCAICEYGSPPTMRQASISKTPGDMGRQNSEGALLPPDPNVMQTGGLTPNMHFFLKDGWAKPGDMLYFNCRFWTNDYDTGKGQTSVQADQLDMAQRSRFSIFWPQDAQ